jgi:hypothetical protein
MAEAGRRPLPRRGNLVVPGHAEEADLQGGTDCRRQKCLSKSFSDWTTFTIARKQLIVFREFSNSVRAQNRDTPPIVR